MNFRKAILVSGMALLVVLASGCAHRHKVRKVVKKAPAVVVKASPVMIAKR